MATDTTTPAYVPQASVSTPTPTPGFADSVLKGLASAPPLRFDSTGNVIPNSTAPVAGPVIPKPVPQQAFPSTSGIFSPTAPLNSSSVAPATPLAIPSPGSAAAASSQQAKDLATYFPSPIKDALIANPVPIPAGHPGTNPDTGLPNPPVAPAAPTSAYDKILGEVGGLTDQLGTRGAVTSALQDQYGLPQKTQDATTAYNNYRQAQVELQQRVEALQTNNPTGQLDPSRQAEIANVTRVGNANLANLAVIAQAASGNLTAAQNIIQAKLDAQFKPIQDQIDYLGKFAELNQNNLSQSQQATIANQRYVLQNQLDTLMAAKQAAHTFALQQGITNPAVLNAIDTAGTPTEAYSAVGGNDKGVPSSSYASSNVGGRLSNIDPEFQGYVDHSADGTPYVNQDRLNNMTPYQRQQASNQYNAAGIRVLQPDEVTALSTLDQAGEDLKLFQKTANNLLSPGALGRLQGLTTNQIAQFIQTDPQWRQFQTLRAGLIKSVQGIAAGAPGLRVTGAELSNAADALPNSADNLESAQQAVSTFGDLLNVNKSILLRTTPSNDKAAGNQSDPFSPSNFNTPLNG